MNKNTCQYCAFKYKNEFKNISESNQFEFVNSAVFKSKVITFYHIHDVIFILSRMKFVGALIQKLWNGIVSSIFLIKDLSKILSKLEFLTNFLDQRKLAWEGSLL